jgi:hypothetical protein
MYLTSCALLLVYGFARVSCVGCAMVRWLEALTASLLILCHITYLFVSWSVTRLNIWRILPLLHVACCIPFVYVALLVSSTRPFPFMSATYMEAWIRPHAWSLWSMCFAHFYVFVLYAITSYTSRNPSVITKQQTSPNKLQTTVAQSMRSLRVQIDPCYLVK